MNDRLNINRFKFRIYCKSEDKMMLFNNPALIDGDIMQGGLLFKNYDHKIRNVHEVDPEDLIFMQCTGKKDKNGVFIYEGDIISGINGSINGSGMEFKTIIKWNNDNCCFNTPKFGSNENPTHWYEVIGNIYENPELLEEKQ